ncbi:hypothetical protein E4T44_03458 [Aureobasidium sp. EXF-8845]|nr:hypothetical protein E4T44_03458 [Aureobasidium sp. EXF-8845]KAI4855106.1 hypothetical protein E4T45_03460 [Aureobasidium sp. EXF-8846]
MRFSSYALPALAANLAAALPRPQDFDFSLIDAAPDPTFTEAVGATAQTITVDPQALIASATAAISSVSVDAGDILSSTAIAHKRAATTCVPQPAGATSAPTYAADADNAANFLANTYYSSVASAAPTPSGYSQAFLNQQASNNAFGYMGFDTMNDYDVAKCATQCTNKFGCVSFNIYFERDPSGKQIFPLSPVSQLNAVNNGQKRGNFDVAIAGSNGYVTTLLATPDGYQSGTPYGKFAINAPYDAQGYNTYMGAKIFTGVWSVAQCSQYCDAQTKYNLATAPKDGTPAKVCKFFNTYLLTAKMANGQIVPQGQYCSLYTEAWPIKYATNGGQWRGQDQYTVDYSFGYAKTDAGLDPLVGDKNGAIYQAVADIKWNKLQPYCSSALGYTTPVVTSYTTTFTTPVSVATVSTTTTTYIVPRQKRDATASAAASTTFDGLPMVPLYSDAVSSAVAAMSSEASANQNRKRALPTSTPADLQKYPATVISSACSLQATPVTVTSTPTVVVTNTALATITTTTAVSVATATTTACSNFRIKISAPGSPADGNYVAGPDALGYFLGSGAQFYSGYAPITFSLDPSNGYLKTDKGLFVINYDFPGGYGDLALWNNLNDYPKVVCAVDWSTFQLTCSSNNPDEVKYLNAAPATWTNLYVQNQGYPWMLIGPPGATAGTPATLSVVCPS